MRKSKPQRRDGRGKGNREPKLARRPIQRRMRAVLRWGLTAVIGALSLLLEPGCTSPVVYYPYRIANDQCNCREYRTRDGGVEYRFRAHYSMHNGLVTRIEIQLFNHSRDTLSLDMGSVRVSSLNVSYQYNNKFVPLPQIVVLPRDSSTVDLSGRDVSGSDDWLLVAGEKLTLTTKGLRLGERELKAQEITFIPENPKLKKENPPE